MSTTASLHGCPTSGLGTRDRPVLSRVEVLARVPWATGPRATLELCLAPLCGGVRTPAARLSGPSRGVRWAHDRTKGRQGGRRYRSGLVR